MEDWIRVSDTHPTAKICCRVMAKRRSGEELEVNYWEKDSYWFKCGSNEFLRDVEFWKPLERKNDKNDNI